MLTVSCDICVIGGGPAGLQTAIYTASEGLATIVVESQKFGGQIRQTPLLENFAGQSSKGISGQSFANKMKRQASAMGTVFESAHVFTVVGNNGSPIVFAARKHEGVQINSKFTVVASGATWQQLDIDGVDEALNRSFFYGPYMTKRVEKGGVYNVIGGGNSSGQAIVELASHAERVNVICRSDLSRMSNYLVDRIKSSPNVAVRTFVNIDRVLPNGILLADGTELYANQTFFAGGSKPNSYVFNGTKDPDRFIVTDDYLQTSIPNIFAIGDVRANVRRRSVGNAIADANNVVASIFQILGNGGRSIGT